MGQTGRLARKVQKWLAPGEAVEHVFRGQGQVCPSALLIRTLAAPFVSRRIVVLTNTGIAVILAAERFPRRKPLRVLRRISRDEVVAGDLGKRWSRVKVGSETLWVSRRFYCELEGAQVVPARPPDWEPASSRAAAHITFSSSVFTLTGLAALVVGLIDTAGAKTNEYRFVGAAFTFTGALLLAAGVVLAVEGWSQRWSRKLGLVACVAGLGACAYLLMSEIGYGTHRGALWALVALALLIATTLIPPADDLAAEAGPGGKTAVERLTAVGVTTGFLLTLFQFWYSTGFAPAHHGVALNLAVAMADQGPSLEDPAMHDVAADITIENKSGAKVQVLNSRWAVRGTPAAVSPAPSDQEGAETGEASSTAAGDLMGFGTVLDDGYYFEPDEKYVVRLTVPVSADALARYTALRLAVDLDVAKGESLQLVDTSGKPTPRAWGDHPDAVQVAEFPIPPVSLIQAVAKGRHAVAVLRWQSVYEGKDGEPYIYTCIDRRGLTGSADKDPTEVCRGKRQDRLRAFYGLTSTGTSFEMPIIAPTRAGSTPAT